MGEIEPSHEDKYFEIEFQGHLISPDTSVVYLYGHALPHLQYETGEYTFEDEIISIHALYTLKKLGFIIKSTQPLSEEEQLDEYFEAREYLVDQIAWWLGHDV